MITDITPVILTYNEEANLDRTLAALTWASEIIIMDSLSTDRTIDIAHRHPRVRLLQRKFDDFASQWAYALEHAAIRTGWVLALDADYVLAPGFEEELRGIVPGAGVSGYRVNFVYMIDGRPLRGSLYPSSVVLFRRGYGKYVMDGHAYRLKIDGTVGQLVTPIYHDDRKTDERWRAGQWTYARQEAAKLAHERWSASSWADRLRRLPFAAPVIVWLYCLFAKGLWTQGAPGWKYAAQRAYAEYALSVCMLRRYLRRTA